MSKSQNSEIFTKRAKSTFRGIGCPDVVVDGPDSHSVLAVLDNSRASDPVVIEKRLLTLVVSVVEGEVVEEASHVTHTIDHVTEVANRPVRVRSEYSPHLCCQS